MSTSTGEPITRADDSVDAASDPQPLHSPEDAKGWRIVARGNRKGAPPPLIRVVVDLDAEQSEWLRQEARRTGLDYVALVERLIDEKRTGSAA